MSDFLLITTGGTIDAEPYEIAQTPEVITPLVQSLVPKMLRQMGVKNFEHQALPPADSKVFLADGARLNLLVEAILKTEYSRVLVTHGTDALGVMAVAVYQALKAAGTQKQVVFSCAMTPLANTRQAEDTFLFEQSDGYANMQRAVEELLQEALPIGVYIAANEGKFFHGNDELPLIRKEFNAPSADKRFFYLDSGAG